MDAPRFSFRCLCSTVYLVHSGLVLFRIPQRYLSLHLLQGHRVRFKIRGQGFYFRLWFCVRYRQVATNTGQAHTPAGARQVQLTVVESCLLEDLEVHHVYRFAHLYQEVPEDAAQQNAQKLQEGENECSDETI